MKYLLKKLEQLRSAGTQNLPDDSLQKKISLRVNELSLYVILINFTVGTSAFVMTYSFRLLWGMAMEIALTLIPIYLNYRRLHNWASLALYLILSTATFFFCCLLGGLGEIDLMIVVLLGAARFFFIKRPVQIIGYVMATCVLIAVQVNRSMGLISPIKVSSRVHFFLFWSAYLVVVFLVINVFEWYARINDHLRELADRESKNKDRFIANASHEIRVSFQSVYAIINILYKIEERYAFNGFKDAISDLRAACKNTGSIVDNIFEYERYTAGRKPVVNVQLVDIRLTLGNIMEIYQHFANEKNVALELAIDDLIPYHIVCDEIKLRQIVTNLLHNAIKFTNNDTAVHIEVELFQRNLVINVRDCGDGIANDVRERIFEPFVTQNPSGLGLGLYIVRELVLALDGCIDVGNNPSGGATVRISWPLPGREAYLMAAMASR